MLAVPPRLCAGERSEPLRICAGSGTTPVMSVSSCDVGPAAVPAIAALALPVPMAELDTLVHDVAELLAAVDSVVFDDADFEATVNEPRPVVPKAFVPRPEVPSPEVPTLEVSTLAGPCATVFVEFGIVAAPVAEEFAAAALAAIAVADVEAESALVAVIPDVLTEGHGTCMPFAAPDMTARPPVVVPGDSMSPPPSKVGNVMFVRLAVMHSAGLRVPE